LIETFNLIRKGEQKTMEEFDGIFNSLVKSIDRSIKDFSGCKDLNQKKTQAEITKLLCESLGVFFNAMQKNAPPPFDDFDMDDYDEDEEYEIEKFKKGKNKKKLGKDDIPF
jgi:hypothetical protein